MEYRVPKNFKKMLLTLSKFQKKFLFVLQLSKSLADVTNLKTITCLGPDFFFCGLREALFLFIRLLMIISTTYYLILFTNTFC